MKKGKEIFLPEAINKDYACLFYVFNGNVQVKESIHLRTGESVLIEKENPSFTALETSDIVLFITKTNAVHFDGGIYSGNLQ